MDWAYGNPHLAFGLFISVTLALGGLVRFVFSRHAEFVEFKKHMDSEEKELWPEVGRLTRAFETWRLASQETSNNFRQEMRDSQAAFRLEVIKMHFDHGERIKGMETALGVNTAMTKEISQIVNGNTTALNARLEMQEREIKILRDAIADSEKRAEMLAQSVAQTMTKQNIEKG